MDVLEMFVGVRQVLDRCAVDGCSIVDGIPIVIFDRAMFYRWPLDFDSCSIDGRSVADGISLAAR